MAHTVVQYREVIAGGPRGPSWPERKQARVTPAATAWRRLFGRAPRERLAEAARITLPGQMPKKTPAEVAQKTPPSRELKMSPTEVT
jgi:hypothetical protein